MKRHIHIAMSQTDVVRIGQCTFRQRNTAADKRSIFVCWGRIQQVQICQRNLIPRWRITDQFLYAPMFCQRHIRPGVRELTVEGHPVGDMLITEYALGLGRIHVKRWQARMP